MQVRVRRRAPSDGNATSTSAASTASVEGQDQDAVGAERVGVRVRGLLVEYEDGAPPSAVIVRTTCSSPGKPTHVTRIEFASTWSTIAVFQRDDMPSPA